MPGGRTGLRFNIRVSEMRVGVRLKWAVRRGAEPNPILTGTLQTSRDGYRALRTMMDAGADRAGVIVEWDERGRSPAAPPVPSVAARIQAEDREILRGFGFEQRPADPARRDDAA